MQLKWTEWEFNRQPLANVTACHSIKDFVVQGWSGINVLDVQQEIIVKM